MAKRDTPLYHQPIIETHFHLDYLKEGSAQEILALARAVGVERFMTISVDPSNMPKVLELAHEHADVWATLGVHPHEAQHFDDACAQFMHAHAKDDKVVAIGEIGLDYFYEHSPREVQRQAFCAQLEIAIAQNLPVVIHTRDADADCAAILKDYAPKMAKKGVLHSFTSGLELAQLAIDLGFCLGINGIVTFGKAENVRDIVRAVPLTHLLLETDAPFLTPLPYRGVENNPKYLPFIAEKIAEVKGVPVHDVLQSCHHNSMRVFFA